MERVARFVLDSRKAKNLVRESGEEGKGVKYKTLTNEILLSLLLIFSKTRVLFIPVVYGK